VEATQITITEARRHFGPIIDVARITGVPVKITKNGRTVATLVPEPAQEAPADSQAH
jgi:prevent-host-death family protein